MSISPPGLAWLGSSQTLPLLCANTPRADPTVQGCSPWHQHVPTPPPPSTAPPDPQEGSCPGYYCTTGLSWRVLCRAPLPSCPYQPATLGLLAISNSTRGSGSEGHEARSNRNLKIWMGKSRGHREGQGRDRRGHGPGMALHKIRNKQDLPIIPFLLNPNTLVMKKTSKKGP